jgi:acetyltransferase-like isoleucine patch superfamily enzyme
MTDVYPVNYKDYLDEDNNEIVIDEGLDAEHSKVSFHGKNNTVVVGKNTHLDRFHIEFYGNNGHFRIGDNSHIIGNIVLGSECTSRIGDNFMCAGRILITTAEKTSITIGNYCRFNGNIQLRTHDSHPIFDINTHERINKSKSIHIGNKVWLGLSVNVLKGVWIGDNCVVGLNSIVTKDIPNNCLAVGSPAEIKRENIDWGLRGLTKSPFPQYNDLMRKI